MGGGCLWGGGGGFEEEQRSGWCRHRGQEGVEVRASGRAGGQPGEEHGRAGGGDGRPTVRSSWGGARARGGRRRVADDEIWLGRSTGGWCGEIWLGTGQVSLIRMWPVSVNFCWPPNSR
jgi:hypothetical protein